MTQRRKKASASPSERPFIVEILEAAVSDIGNEAALIILAKDGRTKIRMEIPYFSEDNDVEERGRSGLDYLLGELGLLGVEEHKAMAGKRLPRWVWEKVESIVTGRKVSSPRANTTEKRKRSPIPQGVRFDVFRRDNFTCVYCGRGSPEVTLHCDHVVPHSKGGSDDKNNLVTACSDCNIGKGAKFLTDTTSNLSQAARADGLVGLYGHTRDGSGNIEWQFRLSHRIDDATYAAHLFSWLDGAPTEVKLMTTDALSRCTLYSTKEAWREQWAKENGNMRRAA